MPDAEQLSRWRRIREAPGNERCAECLVPEPTWLVIDYGILVCIRCAGAHRSLGTHISKVRSIAMDTLSRDELAWVESLGNSKSGSLWGAALPPSMAPPRSDSADSFRCRWVREKYAEQTFVAGSICPEPAAYTRMCGWLLKPGIAPWLSWRRRFYRLGEAGCLLAFADETGESGGGGGGGGGIGGGPLGGA